MPAYKKYPTDPTFLDVAQATPRQREYYAAYIENKSVYDASKSLGIAHQNIYTELDKLVKRAADRGWTEHSDNTRFVPAGQRLVGQSTLTKDEEGNTVWIKTKAEIEDQKKVFAAFVDELANSIKPAKAKPKPKKVKYDPDLLPTIIIGDAHIGMKADGDLTRGRDFDLHIATSEIKTAIASLVECAPTAKNGLLVNVGDFTHSDNSNSTTTKFTPVDMDTRYENVMRSAAHTLIFAIDTMLTKFEKVDVVIARGNHDSDTAIGVQLCLEMYYSKEPRVNMVPQKGFFHYLQWHKNLIAVHHGDKVRAEKLASIMPRDMPKAWAETTHRYWLVGHFHHQDVKECDNGVIIEKKGCLAPPDSWHSGQGYGSASVMDMIVYRKSGGKAITHTYEIPREYHEPDSKIS
jgi:hypothetical protein